MMLITIEPASIKQKSEVIPLLDSASGGKLRFLINNIMPFINVKTIVSMLYARDDNVFSYLHAKVAMLDKESRVAGVLLSYPSSEHKIHDMMREHIPSDRLDHLRPYFESRVENSLYIGSLAIIADCQRQGVGTQLVEYAINQARSDGITCISTHCWADNTAALAFFDELGFEIKATLNIGSTPRLAHDGGMVLLVKNLH